MMMRMSPPPPIVVVVDACARTSTTKSRCCCDVDEFLVDELTTITATTMTTTVMNHQQIHIPQKQHRCSSCSTSRFRSNNESRNRVCAVVDGEEEEEKEVCPLHHHHSNCCCDCLQHQQQQQRRQQQQRCYKEATTTTTRKRDLSGGGSRRCGVDVAATTTTTRRCTTTTTSTAERRNMKSTTTTNGALRVFLVVLLQQLLLLQANFVEATATTLSTTTTTIITTAASRKQQQQQHAHYLDHYHHIWGKQPTSTIDANTMNTVRRRKQQQSRIPNLPWGDINVIVLTDVHSYVGGHMSEPRNQQRNRDLLLHNKDTTKDESGTKSNNNNHNRKRPADYGDVVSFVQHVKSYATQHNYTVFFVMNGDWIDGTGLSMNGDTTYLIPILQKMPYDALNVGNHELYRPTVIDSMIRPAGLMEYFGARYLSSNIVHRATSSSSSQQHIANPYTILQSPTNSGGGNYRVLTFGFLYEMTDYDQTSSIVVQNITTTLQQPWFKNVVSQTTNYDAILILAHMHVTDPLVYEILYAIRNITSSSSSMIPIQFITGHTHIRNYAILDDASTSFEAGYYLNTVGFCSFPAVGQRQSASQSQHATTPADTIAISLEQSQQHGNDEDDNTTSSTYNGTTLPPTLSPTTAPTTASTLFQYRYIDATVEDLALAAGFDAESLDDFATPEGMELSTFIRRIQMELGLKQVVGCIAQPYFLQNRTLSQPDSLWRFFRHHVSPTILPMIKQRISTDSEVGLSLSNTSSTFDPHDPMIFLLGSGSWRNEIYGYDVQVDDVIGVSPFNNTMYMYQNVPTYIVQQLHDRLNNGTRWTPWLPNYIIATETRPTVDNDNGMPLPTDDSTKQQQDNSYTVLVDAFEWSEIDRELRTIVDEYNTNATRAHKEIKIDPAILLPAHIATSTSIWMDYFIHESSTCSKSTQNKFHHDDNKIGTSSTGSTSNHHHSSGNSSDDDTWRLGFMGGGIAIMILLSIMVIYQRNVQFQQRMSQQNFAILEAMNDYNNSHNDDDDEYDDNSAMEDDIHYINPDTCDADEIGEFI